MKAATEVVANFFANFSVAYNRRVKRFFVIFILLVAILGAGSYEGLKYFRSFTRHELAQIVPTTSLPSPTAIPTVAQSQQSEVSALFVPYWSLTSKTPDFSVYNELIYFGVEANESGLDTSESGYTSLQKFLSQAKNVPKKTLALRMIDSSTNLKILANKSEQQMISSQVTSLATQDGFNGVVLDLEVSAIPFDSLIKQITTFTTDLGKTVHASNLSYTVMIYGDAFYRLRPFDVKAIGSGADRVMIMAYDFSKAGSSPGPGFPLSGGSTYGYDYSKLTGDFINAVPKEKLAVTFGMFGYDWPVDDSGKAKATGTAVTTKEGMDSFVTNCKEKHCDWKKDDTSSEVVVNYTAKDDSKHVVWFQSSDSAKLKKDYLKQHGITHFAYWANSYF
jgi:spore germination protein YaaH